MTGSEIMEALAGVREQMGRLEARAVELERANAELKRLLARVVGMVPHESVTLTGDQHALEQAKREAGA